jgi:hypothetical protein
VTTARTRRPRLAAAVLVVAHGAACTPATPPRGTPVAAPAESHAPPPAPAPGPTFAQWDGLYVVTGVDAGVGQRTAWVRTLSASVSLGFGPFVATAAGTPGAAGLRATVSDDRETHAMTLTPPAHTGAPWRIVFDGMSVGYEQHVEPLEALVRERLVVGQRFTRIDQQNPSATGPIDAAKTHDVLMVLPRGIVRTELPDSPHAAPCFIDALVPMANEQGVPLPSPLPAPGALGVARYAMSKVSDCEDANPDAQGHGNDGGAFFFATREGRIPGLLMASYMYAEIFVAPECTRGDLAMMVRAAQEALEQQAE